MANLRPSSVAGATRRLLLLVGISALAGVLVAGLALPIAGALGLAAKSSAETFQSLPDDLETQPLAQRSRVFDASGNLLATFFEQNRVDIPLASIAPVMQNALLASEDARFYKHGPIDLQGTSRAALRNFAADEITGGGSTLTQQYVKLVLVEQAKSAEERKKAQDDTLDRKLRELRLAIAAERQFTKHEILERYFNIAYFGQGAYGIEAAARHYFSVSAAELTLPQAALLAGLVQKPRAYDPEDNPEAAIGRRNVVLGRMADERMITDAEAAQARSSDLGLNVSETPNGCITAYAPFFCQYVEQELTLWEGLGADAEQRRQNLYRGGLTIKTTLDPRIQAAAQNAISAKMAPADAAVGAMSMVEPGTGKIKAMAQSRPMGSDVPAGQSYINYNVDIAHGGGDGFQAGSTMKVFVLAAAIKQGIPLSTTISVPSGMLSLPQNSFTTCEGRYPRHPEPWRVRTPTGTFDIRSGTWRSNNGFYAQLEQRTGLCDAWRFATDLGVTQTSGEPIAQVPAMVLGSTPVVPLDMATAFATFAARGVHCEPTAIAEMLDRNGQPLPVPPSNCRQLLDQAQTDTINDVLRGVIDGPDGGRTGRNLSLGRPAAGKTGTTNEELAVWFSGYTPQLAASMAVGDVDLPRQSMRGMVLNGVRQFSACGGCIPGPMWRDAMRAALDGVPAGDFVAPNPEAVASLRGNVPDVRGLQVSQAVEALTGAGFNAEVGGEVAGDLPPGTVVYTNPRAGSSLAGGRTVRIYVAAALAAPPPAPAPEPVVAAPGIINQGGGGDGNGRRGRRRGGGDGGRRGAAAEAEATSFSDPPLRGLVDRADRRATKAVQVEASVREDLGRQTLTLADQPEQQVLGADVVVTQSQCLAE